MLSGQQHKLQMNGLLSEISNENLNSEKQMSSFTWVEGELVRCKNTTAAKSTPFYQDEIGHRKK